MSSETIFRSARHVKSEVSVVVPRFSSILEGQAHFLLAEPHRETLRCELGGGPHVETRYFHPLRWDAGGWLGNNIAVHGLPPHGGEARLCAGDAMVPIMERVVADGSGVATIPITSELSRRVLDACGVSATHHQAEVNTIRREFGATATSGIPHSPRMRLILEVRMPSSPTMAATDAATDAATEVSMCRTVSVQTHVVMCVSKLAMSCSSDALQQDFIEACMLLPAECLQVARSATAGER